MSERSHAQVMFKHVLYWWDESNSLRARSKEQGVAPRRRKTETRRDATWDIYHESFIKEDILLDLREFITLLLEEPVVVTYFLINSG